MLKALLMLVLVFSFAIMADANSKELEIVMVAKHEGVSWFDAMRVGVNEFGATHDDVNAYQIAPEGGDPAKQVQMVEDLIAKGVDAILVVPNDPKAMIPVLKRAMEAGIVVISHEAEALKGIVNYDLEAFDNDEFGRLMFDTLANEMGGKGEYACIVGALTMETHMQWYNAGKKLIDEKYPDMKEVTDGPMEDNNNEAIAFNKVNEILKSYPKIKGLMSCSASGSSMEALAVEKKRRRSTKVVGLGIPSVNGPYLVSGYQQAAMCWSPADAGYACADVAYKILKGKKVESGMDLGKPGYESIVIKNGVIFGNAPLVLTKENFKEYDF